MAIRDAKRDAAVDQRLRDMMAAAIDLPTPDGLMAFINDLEGLDEGVENRAPRPSPSALRGC